MARTIASDRYVDRAELLDFVRPRHHGILTTIRHDGRTQQSPLTVGLDDSDRVVISTYRERAKVANVRRDPAVSILVLSDDFGGEWVQLYGRAKVLDLPEALDPFVEYFRNIAGEHPDWDEYREAMVKQGKSLIRVTIDEWGPISLGGFRARLANEA
jgi:PPOX class probable F420-dependent enzyme